MIKLIKKFFKLYHIDDLQIGGHCGLCGNWINNKIFEKSWAWGICNNCK